MDTLTRGLQQRPECELGPSPMAPQGPQAAPWGLFGTSPAAARCTTLCSHAFLADRSLPLPQGSLAHRAFPLKAIRGEYSPSDKGEDTETGNGLAAALTQFPSVQSFSVVARKSETAADDFSRSMAESVEQICGEKVQDLTCVERGSKFLSLKMRVLVASPEMAALVYSRLQEDPRVMFKY